MQAVNVEYAEAMCRAIAGKENEYRREQATAGFEPLREAIEFAVQIQSLKSKYNLVQGCVSFPKDLICSKEARIEYDAKNNRFHFEVLQCIISTY